MKFLAFIPALLGAAYAFAAPYVSPLPDGDIAIEFPAASPKNPGPFTIERAEGRFAPTPHRYQNPRRKGIQECVCSRSEIY